MRLSPWMIIGFAGFSLALVSGAWSMRPSGWSRLRVIPEFSLPTLMVEGIPEGDRDEDCLDDEVEWIIASQFAPYYVFDSRENARRDEEPLTLFQVHTGLRRIPGDSESCAEQKLERVVLRYAHLFQRDGGYITSPICGDSHPGDNTFSEVTLRRKEPVSNASRNEIPLVLDEVRVGQTFWSRDLVRMVARTHPMIYFSAGKHHEFPLPARGGVVADSPFSNWGCQDAVDGRGFQRSARLEDDRAPRGFLNVGEAHQHPAEFFAVDLAPLGFPWENAWATRRFCGGLTRNCSDSVSPMDRLWVH